MSDILETPEAIARRIAFENDDWFDISLDVLAARIETALRREREACATIAEEMFDLNKFPDYETPIWANAMGKITKAIRERT